MKRTGMSSLPIATICTFSNSVSFSFGMIEQLLMSEAAIEMLEEVCNSIYLLVIEFLFGILLEKDNIGA